MKLREWFNKLLHQSSKDAERSSDAVDEKFTTTYGQDTARWIPSQQDRPWH
jgi:hypothetical protein